jgi:hypothetical protein
MQLADALLKADKPFDLLIMTKRNHDLSYDPYYLRRLFSYFQEHFEPRAWTACRKTILSHPRSDRFQPPPSTYLCLYPATMASLLHPLPGAKRILPRHADQILALSSLAILARSGSRPPIQTLPSLRRPPAGEDERVKSMYNFDPPMKEIP